jgi:Protein of unknown function (DUF3105)
MSKKSKRKKRRQQRPADYDPNEKRRQRLEEKRRQREEAAKARRRAEFRERLVRGMVFAAVIVAAIWFFFLRTQEPSEIDGFEIQNFRESDGHTNDPVTYESVPPVTGEHREFPAPCGVHDVQIEDELFVHSLEHGAVGVLYDPQQVEVPTIRDVEALVNEYDDRTIAAPYPNMETPITLTSWGELMRLPDFRESTARNYIDEFIGSGPENIECPNESARPFDPQLEPTPTPTPEGDGEEGGRRNNEDGGEGNDSQGNADNNNNNRRNRDSDDS